MTGVLWFGAIGWLLARSLRCVVPSGFVARAATYFLLGASAGGSLLFVLATLGVPFGRPLIACVTAGLVIVGCRARAVRDVCHVPSKASLGVMLPPLLLALWVVPRVPLRDYDGRVTWLLKARAIAYEHGIVGPFFQGDRGLNLHNHYPLLVPLDAAVLLVLSPGEEATQWFFAVTGAALCIFLRDRLARRFGASGAWAGAMIAWTPVLFRLEGGLLSAYADIPLAAFLALGLVAVWSADDATLAVALTALVLTKNEGLPLALSVLGFRLLQRRLSRAVLVSFACLIAALGALTFWRAHIPEAYDERNAALLRDLPWRLDRLQDALVLLAGYGADVREWSLAWYLAAAGAILCWRRRDVRGSVLVIGVAMASYASTFAVSGWDMRELASVAADRLLLHLLAPCAALIAVFGQHLAQSEVDTQKEAGKNPEALRARR